MWIFAAWGQHQQVISQIFAKLIHFSIEDRKYSFILLWRVAIAFRSRKQCSLNGIALGTTQPSLLYRLMPKISIINNEQERLAALHALLILDTPPERRFDRITKFAADEFDVSISVISLVDANRQWFKSKTGLQICGSSRDISICTHGIQSAEPLIISDLTKDSRFATNPFVTGEPHIRFYAGVPLLLGGGFAAGMLCVMDQKTRQFDYVDCAILSSLRDLVVDELKSAPDKTLEKITF